jgi:hypothetical protein
MFWWLKRRPLTDRDTARWQPIESAPRSGMRFLAYTVSRGRYVPELSCQIEIARWDRDHFTSDSGAVPTHWMPLPEPPA